MTSAPSAFSSAMFVQRQVRHESRFQKQLGHGRQEWARQNGTSLKPVSVCGCHTQEDAERSSGQRWCRLIGFLGQNVRDYDGTILVKPSRKKVATFLEKVRGIIKASKHVTAGHLIVNLNPVIRGWANYHRHVTSKRTFSRVDHAIFGALWQWAKRRHPKKSRRGIKDRYFETIDQQHWVFHGTIAGREEVIQPVWLLAASSVPIQRHTKVKGEANPYDPAWEPYFEERLGVKMAGTLMGRWTLRLLWKEQGGICPVCNQKITTVTGWHNHHIVWRTHGGQGHDREPRAGASELPSTDPQPRVRCGKAASCEGRS